MDDHRFMRFCLAVAALCVCVLTPARAEWPGDASRFVTLGPGGKGTDLVDACGDGMGGAFVLWATTGGAPVHTYHLQHLDSAGRLRITPEAWHSVPGDGEPTHLASDGAGGAVMLLKRYVGDTTAELVLRRFGYAGDVLWATTVGTASVPGYYDWGQVVFDPATHGWVVAWLEAGSGGDDLRAQFVDANGATQWPAAVMLGGSPGESATLGRFCPDGHGGAWFSRWAGEFGHHSARIQHARSNGMPEWGANGVAVEMPTNGMVREIAGDALGNLWIALLAIEPSDPSDRIQRLRPDGSQSLGPTGIALPHPERGPRHEASLAVLDPSHASVVWTDIPSSSLTWTTQLEMVDSSGTWSGARHELGAGGVAEYLGIRIHSLASGGALVWCAPGVEGAHPVQRVDAVGEPLWPGGRNVLQPGDNMFGADSPFQMFLPPVSTGDGGVVVFQTLMDTVTTPAEPYPYFVRAQHLDAQGQHGFDPALGAPGPGSARGLSLTVVPSPMTSFARVRFSLPEPGDAQLTLFDASGRRVRSIALGALGAGEHVVPLSRALPGGPPLGAGLYWLRLDAARRSAARDIVILD